MILSGPLTTPSSPTLRRLQSELRPCNFVNFSRPVLEGADSSNASLEGSQCLRFSVSRWIFFTSKNQVAQTWLSFFDCLVRYIEGL